jgi:UDP:flavonoid glycosyltransferase YjiC (YdhE family)
MPTILLTWEFGGGRGHLGRVLPLAVELRNRGHRVIAALKDTNRVREFVPDLSVPFVQAPPEASLRDTGVRLATYTHLLHNLRFGDADYLAIKATAWRHLLELVGPDLIMCDHSPIALLASRAIGCRRAVVGSGFFCPRVQNDRLPLLRPHDAPDESTQAADEERLLDCINGVLGSWHQPALARLAHLYRDVDATFLTTFGELDHFGPRDDAAYFGVWPTGIGEVPEWPQGEGPRVFAYLKPFPGLTALLEELAARKAPALVATDGIDDATIERFSSPRMHFTRRPVELDAAGRWCDFAILNATHAVLCSMLLAGKPIVNIPLQVEQGLLAQRTASLGAGVTAAANDPGACVAALGYVLEHRSALTEGAREFASQYPNYDPRHQLAQLATAVERLVS